MKSPLSLVFLVAACTSAFGESPFLQELTRLTAQRDQALAAADEPIQRRYKEAVEVLLRRATQANDLDAAIKIREAGGGSAVAAATLATPVPGKAALTKLGLERNLEGSTWVTDSNHWLHALSFGKGKVVVNPNKDGKGRNPPFKAIDGATVTFPWDDAQITVTFSGDLSTAQIGPHSYHKQ